MMHLAFNIKNIYKKRQRTLPLFAVLFFCGVLQVSESHAYDTKNPTVYDVEREQKKLENIGINQEKLGSKIDLNLEFKDEDGLPVRLKDLMIQDKPVLLSVVYYQCQSLCNYHMNGVVDVLGNLNLKPNQDYRWIAVSMDENETPQMAKDKKQTYLAKQESRQPQSLMQAWRFLTGDATAIQALTQQLGFRFRWDEETKQFAHASAVYAITPSGQISRIIPGIEFAPQTVQLSLVEAASGQIGTILDKVSLFCFQFNPHKNKYTVYAYNFMKIGAVLTLLLLLIFLGPNLYQSLKKDRIKES